MTFFVEHVNTAVDEVVHVGETECLSDAIALVKRTIDQFLEAHSTLSECADALFAEYASSGLIPCIFQDDGETMNVRSFDHFDYACMKCVRLFDAAEPMNIW